MLLKKLLIIPLFFLITFTVVKAQDPGFSQFYANVLYLNPAFAGQDKCPRIGLNYRNQWPALGSTYVTYSVAYDQHVDFLEGGIGLLIMNDVQGDGAITTTGINGMYSYTAPITRNFSLKFAIQVSYIQKKLNWDFIFPDMIHPLYGAIYKTTEQPPDDLSKGYFDFSGGLVGYNKKSFFGVAVHHFTQPMESFQGSSDAILPMKLTVHAGSNIELSSRRFRRNQLFIAPNLLFQQQQNFQQINYGMYLNRNSIVMGVWFRQNLAFHYDSFIMLLGFVQDKIKFAYSYDLTISKLKNQTLGAHEISFSTTFNCRTKRVRLRTISCPSF